MLLSEREAHAPKWGCKMSYPKCGSEYESGHIFCANCGTRLSEGHGQGQGHDQSNMVIWFDDYLNWTLVLAMVAITVFFVVVAGVTASVSSDSDAAAVNGGGHAAVHCLEHGCWSLGSEAEGPEPVVGSFL